MVYIHMFIVKGIEDKTIRMGKTQVDAMKEMEIN
jgi:hypothetical protein